MPLPYMTAGEWYPQGGWTSLPAWVNPFAVGVQSWDGRWYIEYLSPAWDTYSAGPGTTNAPKQAEPHVGRPSQAAGVDGTQADDMPDQFANDPQLGVVPVGQVTDASTASQAFRLPARMVAKLLPAGPVAPWIASVLDALPWAVWGLLAYVVWKKTPK